MSQNQTSNIVNIAQTLAEGKLPSEKLISAEITPATQYLAEKEKAATTAEKEKTIHDTRKLLEAFDQLLTDKNLTEKMNKLMESAKRVSEHTVPVSGKTTGQILNQTAQFVNSIRELIPDLIQSSQFRRSVIELFSLFRDVFNMKQQQHQEGVDRVQKDFEQGKPMSMVATEAMIEATSVAGELKDEDLPEEIRQRFRETFKNMLTELKNNQNASKAFQRFLKLWDILSVELNAQLSRTQVDKDVLEFQETAQELIEAFAGRRIDQFLAHAKASIELIQNDQQLQEYLQQFREYLNRGIDNPELIAQEEYMNEGDRLVRKGRKLANKYQNNNTLSSCVDDLYGVVESIKTDEQLENLTTRAASLAKDFTYTDITGTSHVNTDLISQMRAELMPFLIDRIKAIPMPGFKVENEDFEYLEVDNLHVNLEDVLPDKIKIYTKNDTDITIKNFENPVKSETIVRFYMSGIRPIFEDLQFRFKRRGLIKLEDEGVAKLTLLGRGLSIRVDFDVDLDTQNRAVLGDFKSYVSVDAIDLDIKEADHKVLLNMFAGLFSPRIKTELEKSIKDRVQEIGGDWANIINKRVLAAISINKIGASVQAAVQNTILPAITP